MKIFKVILPIYGWGTSCDIALRWMSLDLADDESTLVQVMAWCRQATSHYLSQCWPSSMSPYGITRPQWINSSCYRVKIFTFRNFLKFFTGFPFQTVIPFSVWGRFFCWFPRGWRTTRSQNPVFIRFSGSSWSWGKSVEVARLLWNTGKKYSFTYLIKKIRPGLKGCQKSFF